MSWAALRPAGKRDSPRGAPTARALTTVYATRAPKSSGGVDGRENFVYHDQHARFRRARKRDDTMTPQLAPPRGIRSTEPKVGGSNPSGCATDRHERAKAHMQPGHLSGLMQRMERAIAGRHAVQCELFGGGQ